MPTYDSLLATLRAIAADLDRAAAFCGPHILPDVITARQRALGAIANAEASPPAAPTEPALAAYVVAYLPHYADGNEPEYFRCMAENEAHAIDQTANAEPRASILRVRPASYSDNMWD